MGKSTFREELISLINRHSRENRSNTPDHILANYMLQSLEAFESAVTSREIWYGREDTSPVEVDVPVTRK